MTQTLLLKKATRIEGNAEIDIEIDNGRVKRGRFLVREFRGFERFVRDRRVEYVPQLVSRICGLCSCAHQVASFRAIENAMGITVSPSVEALRDILVLGEWISSHALSYFFLSLPDSIEAKKGIFELIEKHPEIGNDAFFLREAGLQISSAIGKRAVHPVSLGIGRFLDPPAPDDLARVRGLAEEIQSRLKRLIPRITLVNSVHPPIQFPQDIQLNFVAFENHRQQGVFKVFDRGGKVLSEFDPESFEEAVAEIRTDWSFSKVPYLRQFGFPGGIMLVGPLARTFLAKGILSDREIEQFEVTRPLCDPQRLSFESFDICRILEIFWAAKKICDLLNRVDLNDSEQKPDYKITGRGIGVLEAPRGILVHSYLIRKGYIEKLRLIVATQFNNAFINLLITDLAQKYIEGEHLSAKGEKQIGRCIRLLDPCLSCATH
jgi:coenzyme F420-reducing hydrogenase alpha subunit